MEGGLEQPSFAQPKFPVNQWEPVAEQDAPGFHASPADVVFMIVLQNIFDVIGIGDEQIGFVEQFELGDAAVLARGPFEQTEHVADHFGHDAEEGESARTGDGFERRWAGLCHPLDFIRNCMDFEWRGLAPNKKSEP